MEYIKKYLDEKIEFVDLASNNELFERNKSKYGFLKAVFIIGIYL